MKKLGKLLRNLLIICGVLFIIILTLVLISRLIGRRYNYE